MNTENTEETSTSHETTAYISTFVRRLFCPVVIFGQLWGIVSIVLAVMWMRTYGGFGWTVDNIFNLHPVLLTVGMVYLQGQGTKEVLHPYYTVKLVFSDPSLSTFSLQTKTDPEVEPWDFARDNIRNHMLGLGGRVQLP